ncbi:hypothetical protein AQUSIP_06730 [Aquicella siphonis]|uniref:DUF2231 domain-containing protein n=1 Tax=Aquicella siphonis TaxID=254247 RepID=A0A5E4PG60_9COXI|nr:DUF2231 domain-containing protein [Aquicella siphonis]VVC75383.1 hypothetical protein AQUSIP_06730 [Aquicella siphonis]
MINSSFLAQLLRARIAGHPVHSMLVHFPSALFPMSLIFDILSIFTQNQCLACAAFYCLGGGIILGLSAAFAGAIDYSHLPSTHTAWYKASLHALLNVTWIILFSIVFGIKMKKFPNIAYASPIEIIISSASVIGLIYSNYLGGDLVFRDKLGFDQTNKNND